MPLNFQFLTRDYSLGWRAVIHYGEKVFVNQERIRTVRTYDNENWSEYWNKLRQMHLSYTWKERHAKGVPVKMTLDEWRDCVDKYWRNQKPDHRRIQRPALLEPSGNVEIMISDWWDTTDDCSAAFCNFRYKPEWLEKKGGTNGTK